ncbi:MAG: thermonuclease family protein [Devosia sp.]|nr:thermonuclease family protein [Devosia sp.]
MLLLFGAAAYLAARFDPLPPRFSGTAQAADGDSLRLRGDRIRLLDIDAPELDQICWEAEGGEWPCGRAAHRRLVDLLRQGATSCQPQKQDTYGRTLASCTVGGRDLGAVLVSEGMAIAHGGYEREEAAARSARIGIWRGRFVEPRQWRDEGPSGAPEPSLFELIWDWFRELTGATILR